MAQQRRQQGGVRGPGVTCVAAVQHVVEPWPDRGGDGPAPRGCEPQRRPATYRDAMVLGRSVVVSDVPGVRDVLADSVTGLGVVGALPA